MSRILQLYSLATPNGIKIAFALEALGIPYQAHTIDIRKGDQFTEEFKKINPNSKIPAIVDYDEKGEPFTVFESGAILLHLAEKTGKLIPKDPKKRLETIQWLFWQMAGLGPMFGQFGHFTVYAKEQIPYAIDRYTTEAKRLLGVLNKQLEGHDYMIDNELTIADIATAPWVLCLEKYYKGGEKVGLDSFTNVVAWMNRIKDNPHFQKALTVTPFPQST